MAIYKLHRKQIVEGTLQECWDFFSNPKNLSTITPPWLEFKVLSELPDEIYPGMMIKYRVRPLWGIPVKWLTEIAHVNPLKSFVDEQRVGPYRLWHHEHCFRQIKSNQVEIEDIVHYVLPLGVFGALTHPILVAPKLEEIFSYRAETISRIFKEVPQREMSA